MARITWSEVGGRLYEAGIDRGVLYIGNNPGIPWSGLQAVKRSRSGGEAKPRYIDGVRVSNHASPEHFEATIEAFTYPEAFAQCDGTAAYQNGLRVKQQKRSSFGMVYRTRVGNDSRGLELAYKIHILYNLRAEPSDHDHETLGEDVDPMTFSWNVTARTEQIAGFLPTASLEIDSRDVPTALLQEIENILYGDATRDASLPSMGELLFLFDSFEDLVYDAGDVLTPVFSIHDAGSISTAVTTTIDSGGV